MNPALPAWEYIIAYWFNESAIKRTMPETSEPFMSVLFFNLFWCKCFLSNNKISGKRQIEPKKHLIELNVKGPICSMPDFWATKDNPAINAEMNKDKLQKKCNFFCVIFILLKLLICVTITVYAFIGTQSQIFISKS